MRWNDNTVVSEQPFGKDGGERTFARGALWAPRPTARSQSVASPSPASSAAVGGRIQRSIACHNVNEIG